MLAVFGLGCVGVAYFSYWAFIDYAALSQADTELLTVINNGSDLRTVFIAESRQQIHRINLFAEGVWALQSGIFAVIGLHGVCTLSGRRSRH
ncbi:MAG: hypothetical protein F6J87_25525 [Spirulina sp. SIO3F2]|nr:hypothetical protein [Spirulina sp. SIO3F2]